MINGKVENIASNYDFNTPKAPTFLERRGLWSIKIKKLPAGDSLAVKPQKVAT